jgi:hypothetical protein
MTKTLYRRTEVEQIIGMLPLQLYNRHLPCGENAIRHRSALLRLLPLPSVSTIDRILAKNALTHPRNSF